MTLQEYIDEVKLRLNRYNVVIDTNDMLLMTYINKGRKAAQKMSLPIVSQRYGRIINIPGTQFTVDATAQIAKVSNSVTFISTALPVDLIDVDNVIIRYNDLPSNTSFRKEARRMDKEEVYNLSLSDWNTPTIDRPTYTVEHLLFSNTANNGKLLLIAGMNNGSNVPPVNIANIIVTLWYIGIIPDLNIMSETEQFLSPDLQEFTVYYAMLCCIRDMKQTENYQTVSMSLNKLLQQLTGMYTTEKVLDVKELSTNDNVS